MSCLSFQALFWEGVYELVHMYSYNGKRYTTISDTLSGRLSSSNPNRDQH